MAEAVELASLMSQLAEHAELRPDVLREVAVQSDADQRRNDYRSAIDNAQVFLICLVGNIALELRRSPGESIADFRNRDICIRSLPRSCRLLEHKRFLQAAEKAAVMHAYTSAVVPETDNGMSLGAWSQITRHMVFATAERIITRYIAWKAGCSCADGGPVEAILFQPIGGGPAYERAICKQCHCPRNLSADATVPAANDVPASANATRRDSEPAKLPVSVCEVLSRLDKRELLMACVRSFELLCGLVTPQRLNA